MNTDVKEHKEYYGTIEPKPTHTTPPPEGWVCVGAGGRDSNGDRKLPKIPIYGGYYSHGRWRTRGWVGSSSLKVYYLPEGSPYLKVAPDQVPAVDQVPPVSMPAGVDYPPEPGFVYVGKGEGAVRALGESLRDLPNRIAPFYTRWEYASPKGMWDGGWAGEDSTKDYWLPADSPYLYRGAPTPPKPKTIWVALSCGQVATVTPGHVRVGCQTFPWDEVARVKGALNTWTVHLGRRCSVDIVPTGEVRVPGESGMFTVTFEDCKKLLAAFAQLNTESKV